MRKTEQYDVYTCLTATVISVAAFCYGAFKLFRNKIPLYFKIIVFAVGCYALEEVSSLITYLCGGFENYLTVNALGAFGCYFFLLSVNYGQIDGVVDDGSPECIKARRIALIAPAVLSAVLIDSFLDMLKISDPLTAGLGLAISAPIPFAAYFSLKHLVIKDDAFGFLKTTRAYNFMALIHYFLEIMYIYSSLRYPVIGLVMEIMLPVSLFGMIIAAVKGAEIWKTLI